MNGQPCKIGECTRRAASRGMCNTHYERFRLGRDLLAPIKERKQDRGCAIDGCDRKHDCHGLCAVHRYRQNKGLPLDKPIRSYAPPDTTCTIDGCDRPARGGMCKAHRQRSYDGRPMQGIISSRCPFDDMPSVLEFYSEETSDGCLIWIGCPSGNGYGQVRDRRAGINRGAHRVSYELANNVSLDPSTPVHHTCANRLCINPNHLQAVTPEENTAEMLERKYYKKRIIELETRLAVLAQGT